MTTADIAKYYVDLLIIQYRGNTKARATVDALVTEVIMDQIPTEVQNAFNLDTAVGAQLDILAKYAGVSRNSLSLTGPVTLTDDDLRLLIKIKIIQNNANSSLYDIQQLLHIFFPDILFVFDYQNMQMSYVFDSHFGSATLASVFVREKLLPKPMGVQISSLIYVPNPSDLFAFRTYALDNPLSCGFNDYTDIVTGTHWVTYDNAI